MADALDRRRLKIDRAYEAYVQHPLGEPDAWGDLESFHEAIQLSRGVREIR